ncbi:hypothetical protein [Streptomyces sp. NPDC059129]|uniref:hypothetical protein n=1 Tax=unclassified Streptomyces TaxID=2593676 RepID=UPI00368973D4
MFAKSSKLDSAAAAQAQRSSDPAAKEEGARDGKNVKDAGTSRAPDDDVDSAE